MEKKILMTETAPNDNVYCTATSLAGPWSAWADFATAGSNTFSSQTAAIVNINGVVMYVFLSSHLLATIEIRISLRQSNSDFHPGTWATVGNPQTL
jgi:cytochrome b subunit of formate dehydrogenase